MASQLHTYTARVSWSGGREGVGSISNDNSGQGFDLRVPPEFGGPGGALNPEELLTDAIAGCYSITFGIVAGNRRIPVKSVEVEAVGTVDQSGANFVYKSVALSPKITLGAEATDQDIATAVDMAHKADAYCIITNAVRGKVEVSVKPSVQREGQAAEETKPVSGDQSLNAPFSAPAATSAQATSASSTSQNTMPENTNASTPGADTAPNPNVSYEGSLETADQYGGAQEAQKPGSATGTSESQAGTSGGSGHSGSTDASSSGAGSEAGLNTDEQAGGGTQGGSNPANSEADDVSASSQETGNPGSMQVGAIPG